MDGIIKNQLRRLGTDGSDSLFEMSEQSWDVISERERTGVRLA